MHFSYMSNCTKHMYMLPSLLQICSGVLFVSLSRGSNLSSTSFRVSFDFLVTVFR